MSLISGVRVEDWVFLGLFTLLILFFWKREGEDD